MNPAADIASLTDDEQSAPTTISSVMPGLVIAPLTPFDVVLERLEASRDRWRQGLHVLASEQAHMTPYEKRLIVVMVAYTATRIAEDAREVLLRPDIAHPTVREAAEIANKGLILFYTAVWMYFYDLFWSFFGHWHFGSIPEGGKR